MALRIFLAGSIPKGDDKRKEWKDWKTNYIEKLSTIKEIEFADPDDWRDETKPLILFGHDVNMVKTSDIIIVNAEKKLGVGTSQEMVIAKYFSKPVITILPKDTHHRRSNVVFDKTLIKDWIHPFVFTISDLVVEDISEAIDWIKEYQKDPKSKKIKDISIIDESINSYLKK
ncbi:hypothetical protein KY331_01010 [Candidatus Woesearchaeota archaeon]|nr:hypothetical protein [Candidatus Woesearchaeota archaeon]